MCKTLVVCTVNMDFVGLRLEVKLKMGRVIICL